MTRGGGIWVGQLDLDDDTRDDDTAVSPVSAAGTADYELARVLVRLHRAPIGYVHVAMHPEQTLSERVHAAAAAQLAEPLRAHLEQDQCDAKQAGRHDWDVRVQCPQRFPAAAGTGLTIIVCTRERPEYLLDCLGALQRVTYSPVEILVVDNAPVSRTTRSLVTELARRDARFRYTCEPRPGLSRARNHGAAAATFDLLAFTDDDILVDPGWPAALVAGFAADPDASCITGLVASRSLDTGAERYFDSRYTWAESFSPRRYDLAVNRDKSPLYPYSAGIFGTGANFAIRRPVIDSVGGFDPRLGAGGPGRGGEDLDMFVRVILAGRRLCYLPSALVWHRHRAEDKALAEQIYAYGYGLGAYLAKRLIAHDMPAAMLTRGLGQAAVIAARMRRASQASQFKVRGGRLAAVEAWGVLAGAARFYRASGQRPDQ